MMKNSYPVIIFILGVAVGMIGWNIANLTMSPVYANASAGESGGIIAVTGLVTQQRSGLWVVDTRDAKTSPSIALYIAETNGKGIRFTGARRIKWDLQLVSFEDRTRRFTPLYVRDQLKKIEDKAEARNQRR